MTAVTMASVDRSADADLVLSTLNGSPDAFGALVARYHAPIVGLAYRFTRSREEADDVAQTALLRAYRHLATFRRDRSFSRWLFMIARNTSIDVVRRKRRDAAIAVAMPDSPPGPEELVVQLDEASRVRAAVDALPEPSRTVLRLHYLDGLKYREIAEALEIPLGTVKTYISRAKRRLHEKILQAARES
jgi:RNA polymerase sigma-70 factor (ECF subfamily)